MFWGYPKFSIVSYFSQTHYARFFGLLALGRVRPSMKSLLAYFMSHLWLQVGSSTSYSDLQTVKR